MILRRLTQHVKDQNWFAVALDFFIVVVGILIAFQITNCSEASNQRKLESEYMTLLARDIATIEMALHQQIVQDQHIAANAKIALAKINNRHAGMDPLDIGKSLTSIFGRPVEDEWMTVFPLIAKDYAMALQNENRRRADRGTTPLPLDETLSDALDVTCQDVIQSTHWPNIDMIGAQLNLYWAEVQIPVIRS